MKSITKNGEKAVLNGNFFFLVLPIFFVAFFTCNNNSLLNIEVDQIQGVKFIYLPKDIDPNIAVSTFDDIFRYQDVLTANSSQK